MILGNTLEIPSTRSGISEGSHWLNNRRGRLKWSIREIKKKKTLLQWCIFICIKGGRNLSNIQPILQGTFFSLTGTMGSSQSASPSLNADSERCKLWRIWKALPESWIRQSTGPGPRLIKSRMCCQRAKWNLIDHSQDEAFQG